MNVNIRMTIDCPTHFLPRLEQSLSRAGLAIRPTIRNGMQRWELAPKGATGQPSIPETIIAASPQDAS